MYSLGLGLIMRMEAAGWRSKGAAEKTVKKTINGPMEKSCGSTIPEFGEIGMWSTEKFP